MRTFQILTLIVFIFSFSGVNAQWSILEGDTTKHVNWYLTQKFTPEEWKASNFASEKDMKWFSDARYGMFIHFGLSTYIGKDLSWGMCYTRKAPDGGYGPIADSIWTKYPEKFVFADFDAKKWVDIAKKAGMKYIVTIAKHHDGFHLWDTKYSDFKVTNTPFGRDYLKEIADACHEAGMKFGIYYSQCDWYHPDYQPADASLIVGQSSPPYFKARPGVTEIIPGPNHQKYIDYQFNVVRELCTNYDKVDAFWFDACWWGGMFTADMWESEKLTRMMRQLQSGIIINNRASIPGDFDTAEQKISMYQSRPCESCVTLCGSWSWSDTPNKSAKALVQMISATACGNGNMLLSWGPKWDGAFDPAQIARLEEVGAWLKKYGHTIYNTKGGPWYPKSWGGSTFSGNKVYLHITGKAGNELVLPAVHNRILRAQCLAGGEVVFSQNEKGVRINLEKAATDQLSVIVELTFDKNISGMVEQLAGQSKFDAPEYGGVILKKTGLKGKDGSLTLDLKKMYTVTGLDIRKSYTATPRTILVEVSEDGVNWKKAEETVKSFTKWEVTVTRLSAGIELTGVKARYVKVSQAGSEKDVLQLESRWFMVNKRRNDYHSVFKQIGRRCSAKYTSKGQSFTPCFFHNWLFGKKEFTLVLICQKRKYG